MLGKRGSMMLFLRGLPVDLTRKELKAFVQTALKGPSHRSFTRKANICNCTILCITDQSSGNIEHHGLVEIQPPKAAIDAIQQLNGSALKGTPIQVRRYHHRSPLRARHRNETIQDQGENRWDERRRANLKIDLAGV